MRRRLSARRPLPWSWWLPLLAAGLLAGQSVAGYGRGAAALVVAGALAAPATLVVHRAAGSALVLATLAATVGAAQAAWRDAARERRAASFPAVPTLVHGRVRGVRPRPARGGGTAVVVDLVASEASGPLAAGDLLRLAVWRTRHAWRVGESVAVRTVLRTPRGFCNDGDDGYARAMWRAGVSAVAGVADERLLTITPAEGGRGDLRAHLGAARASITAAIDAVVPGDGERAVLHALVVGDHGGISPALRRAYARTGTAHVLSVSGLHIALVAMTAYAVLHALLVRWPRLALRVLAARVAACAALLPAAFYALLSGAAVATTRSLVMGALGLGAVVLLRRAQVWTALAAAALLLGAADPGIAGEVSFQLSFASVAGLVVAGQWFEAWRRGAGRPWLDRIHLRGRVLSLVLGALTVSAAAGLVTAPITAYHFGSVALVGVVANLLVVPWVGGLVLLLALAGAALLPLGTAPAALLFAAAGRALRPGNRLVEWIGGWRWSALDVGLASPLEVVALLAILAAISLPRGAARRGAVVLAVLCGAVVGTDLALHAATPRLVVRFLDVGQGDATLVRLAGSGRALLVDGGGLGGSFDTGDRVLLPALRRAGIASLSAVALSHPERDHYGGLAAVVRDVRVAELWSNGRDAPARGFRELLDLLRVRGVARRDLVAGDRPLPPGPDGVVRVLHPPRHGSAGRGNDASLVLALRFGATRLLLTGDLEAPAEGSLLRRGEDPAATIVKVPHHGSRTSSTRPLVLAARPGVAVAMLGAGNRFGFPAPEVRARYRQAGAAWRETDRDGAVEVDSDGQLEQVTTCRAPAGSQTAERRPPAGAACRSGRSGTRSRSCRRPGGS